MATSKNVACDSKLPQTVKTTTKAIACTRRNDETADLTVNNSNINVVEGPYSHVADDSEINVL